MTFKTKCAILVCMYIAQGLPYGFFTQALPVLLRKEGIDLVTIGLGGVAALPWAFKFLWAPVVDHYGHRKQWVLASNLIAVVGLIILSLLPLTFSSVAAVTVLFGFFCFLNASSATQDIATDGLAVSGLSHQERGLGNGIQVAGYRVGMIIAGGGIVFAFQLLGWRCSLWALAALMLMFTWPVLFWRPCDVSKKSSTSLTKSYESLKTFWQREGILGWVFLLLSFKLPDALSVPMVRPMVVDHGYTLTEISSIFGVVGFSAGLMGALVGGYLVTTLGRYRSLLIFSVAQALSVSLWYFCALDIGGRSMITIVVGIEHFAGGLATAALFTVMMDFCRKHSECTDYSIQACLVVSSSIAASMVSGAMASGFGYATHFIVCASVGVIPIILVLLYSQQYFKRRCYESQYYPA